jgi:hypothetical protein
MTSIPHHLAVRNPDGQPDHPLRGGILAHGIVHSHNKAKLSGSLSGLPRKKPECKYDKVLGLFDRAAEHAFIGIHKCRLLFPASRLTNSDSPPNLRPDSHPRRVVLDGRK